MSDDDLMPWQIIQNLATERESWSDAEILAELRALPILPDVNYYYYTKLSDELRQKIHELNLYLAILDLACERHLIDAIPLLLERASYGDPGETMRSLPDHLYYIADTGESSPLERLRPYLIAATHSPYPGARLWAADALRNEDPSFIDVLLPMLNDPAISVVGKAAFSLGWHAKQYPDHCVRILRALQDALARRPEPSDGGRWSTIGDVIKTIACSTSEA